MDYYVFVEKKKEDHPYYERGSDYCFVLVDDKKHRLYGDVLLTIGQRYIFHIEADGHPFYLGRNGKGTQDGSFYDAINVQGNIGITRGGTLVFTPTERDVGTYYECSHHLFMGGKLVLAIPSDDKEMIQLTEDKVDDAFMRDEKVYYTTDKKKLYRSGSQNVLLYTCPDGSELLSADVAPLSKTIWTFEKEGEVVFLKRMGTKKFLLKTKKLDEKCSITFKSESILFIYHAKSFYRLEIDKEQRVVPCTDNPYYCDGNPWLYSTGYESPSRPTWDEDNGFVTDGDTVKQILPSKSRIIFTYPYALGTEMVGVYAEHGKVIVGDQTGRIFKITKDHIIPIYIGPPNVSFSLYSGGNIVISNEGTLFMLKKKVYAGPRITKKMNDLVAEDIERKKLDQLVRAYNRQGRRRLRLRGY